MATNAVIDASQFSLFALGSDAARSLSFILISDAEVMRLVGVQISSKQVRIMATCPNISGVNSRANIMLEPNRTMRPITWAEPSQKRLFEKVLLACCIVASEDCFITWLMNETLDYGGYR